MSYCYDPVGQRCLGHQAGTDQLMTWLVGRYKKATNYGTYVCRGNTGGSGLSLHAEGRAGDVGFPGYHNPEGYRLRDWLISVAEPLGLQEVIWARRIWSARKPYLHDYTGQNPHDDHVHYGLCWWSARAWTLAKLDYLFGGAAAPTPEDDDMPASPIQRGTAGPLYAVVGGHAKALGSLDELVQYVNAGLVRSGSHYSMNPAYFDALFGNPVRWP